MVHKGPKRRGVHIMQRAVNKYAVADMATDCRISVGTPCRAFPPFHHFFANFSYNRLLTELNANRATKRVIKFTVKQS
jgi:hypothetical protein